MNNLAIIVLNYNSYLETIDCVRKLISFCEDFKIVIVDNSSTNDSYKIISNEFQHYTNVSVIESYENGGYGKGNNFGCRYAVAHYSDVDTLAIMNPDVRLENIEIINNMLNTLRDNPDCAIVGASTISSDGVFIPGYSIWNIPNDKEVVMNYATPLKRSRSCKMISNGIAAVDCVLGAFFMTPLNKFVELGMFDENMYLYNEENVLGIKCKQKGYSVLWLINDYYIHGISKNKNEKKVNKLKKFINMQKLTHASYISRRYLIRKFYKNKTLKLLFLDFVYVICTIATTLKLIQKNIKQLKQ